MNNVSQSLLENIVLGRNTYVFSCSPFRVRFRVRNRVRVRVRIRDRDRVRVRVRLFSPSALHHLHCTEYRNGVTHCST